MSLNHERVSSASHIVDREIQAALHFSAVSASPCEFLDLSKTYPPELRIQIEEKCLPACTRVRGGNPRRRIDVLDDCYLRQVMCFNPAVRRSPVSLILSITVCFVIPCSLRNPFGQFLRKSLLGPNWPVLGPGLKSPSPPNQAR